MQRRLVIGYQSLGTAYPSHIQGSSIVCPETSVSNYHYTLRNIPEELISHLRRKDQNTVSHYTMQGIMGGNKYWIWEECRRSYYIYIRHCKKKTTTKKTGHHETTSQNVVARVDSFSKLMLSKNKNIHALSTETGDRGGTVLRVLCYISEVADSIPVGVTGIFHWHNPSDRTMPLGSPQPLIEMSTRSRCVRLTTLPPSCAVVMKSGSLNFLEPSGPVQACNGTALPLLFKRDMKRVLFNRLAPELFFLILANLYIKCE